MNSRFNAYYRMMLKMHAVTVYNIISGIYYIYILEYIGAHKRWQNTIYDCISMYTSYSIELDVGSSNPPIYRLAPVRFVWNRFSIKRTNIKSMHIGLKTSGSYSSSRSRNSNKEEWIWIPKDKSQASKAPIQSGKLFRENVLFQERF